MSKVKTGNNTRQRHNKVLNLAKGYRMSRSTLFKSAQEAVLHAGEYAFAGRKLRKRNFRTLWIVRMNAALKDLGTNYSTFINKLTTQNIGLDRKILAYFAAEKPGIFKKIVEKVN